LAYLLQHRTRFHDPGEAVIAARGVETIPLFGGFVYLSGKKFPGKRKRFFFNRFLESDEK
jgi:hypothetical protein